MWEFLTQAKRRLEWGTRYKTQAAVALANYSATMFVAPRMRKIRQPEKAIFCLATLLIVSSSGLLQAQDGAPANNTATETRVVVGTSQKDSGSAIVIPPSTSVRIQLQTANSSAQNNPSTPPNWPVGDAELNGLKSEVQPWHIIVSYDQFDEDGDNVHSGTYEEFWNGVNKYKRIYKSDNLNQTDYATPHGLYRLGDQSWPDKAQLQVREAIVEPFAYVETLLGFNAVTGERSFGSHKLRCVALENPSRKSSDPAQYCFDNDRMALRYSRGSAWLQVTYNNIVSFQGHYIGRDVDVTDGGKPFLKLHVETIENILSTNDADFIPPPDAKGPIGERIAVVQTHPLRTSFPKWPQSMSSQHFSVTVAIVIGKDGHVLSAQALNGTPEQSKPCEDAVRQWIYAPYFVAGKPVEVETKTTFNYQ